LACRQEPIEREAAQTMIVRYSPGSRRLTLRDLNITPHIAQNATNRISLIDARTRAIWVMRSAQRTEEPFGWAKTIGRRSGAFVLQVDRNVRQTRLRACCQLV
jgi:hypothetical protein